MMNNGEVGINHGNVDYTMNNGWVGANHGNAAYTMNNGGTNNDNKAIHHEGGQHMMNN